MEIYGTDLRFVQYVLCLAHLIGLQGTSCATRYGRMYLIALSQKNIPSAYVSKAYSDSPDYARERFREWY